MGGDAGDDKLFGEGGDDRMRGGDGKDTIDGGTGIDLATYTEKVAAVQVTLNGSTAATVKVGIFNEDTVKNVENINGGDGNDVLTGDGLVNQFVGFGGNDTLRGAGGDDKLFGVDGEDQLFGDNGDDSLLGGAGEDQLSGGNGDDKLTGGFNADTIDGGAGVDTALYDDKTVAVEVTLNGAGNASVFVNGVLEDTIKNVENVTGGTGNDTLIGDAMANALAGGAGADTLGGGLGEDMLTGNVGKDTFVFNVKAKPPNADHITDFNGDVIALDNNIFKALKKDGALKAKFFTVGNKAKDKNDFVVFNNKEDALYYDKDGKGGKSAKLVAVLDNGADLAAGDILVI
jgi:Ca2+-binding RTX toxin-like protein